VPQFRIPRESSARIFNFRGYCNVVGHECYRIENKIILKANFKIPAGTNCGHSMALQLCSLERMTEMIEERENGVAMKRENISTATSNASNNAQT
jgi:hypothetical protein